MKNLVNSSIFEDLKMHSDPIATFNFHDQAPVLCSRSVSIVENRKKPRCRDTSIKQI
jgi:hypothetical protein